MAGMARIGIIVRGGLIGLMLAAYGCRNESRSASGVQTGPQATVVKTPEDKTGSQNMQPPVAEVHTRQDQSIQSKPDESQPVVDLTLRFAPGAAATYKVAVEQGKSVAWQGAASTRPAGFEDGRTDSRIEMTFGQEVQTVDPVGDAVVKITIQALKYFNRVHNKVGSRLRQHETGGPGEPPGQAHRPELQDQAFPQRRCAGNRGGHSSSLRGPGEFPRICDGAETTV